MPFESIIITGTSCAGKSTIAKELSNNFSNKVCFEQVTAITTRAMRLDDSIYDYVDDRKFDDLVKERKLLVDSSYRNKKYGIKKEEYFKIVNAKKIPVLVVTPDAATKLLNEYPEKFMCIFLDADDEILIDRFVEREKKGEKQKEIDIFRKQCDEDRSYQDRAHYIINNKDLATSASLIYSLWSYQYQGGALPQSIIKKMIACDMLLKDADQDKINGASYDLRLGDEYYYGGKIQKLSDKKPFLTIEPYDYAIVSCKEKAYIPRDIIAKFGLTVGLFCQGIILSNGPQIDPGFRGTLFCLLFNTSNRPVHLKRGKHYASIEFNKLIGYAEPYTGKYQGKEHIIEYIPENALHGAINELKTEIENLKKESKTMQNIYLGVVALMFAIISILLVVK